MKILKIKEIGKKQNPHPFPLKKTDRIQKEYKLNCSTKLSFIDRKIKERFATTEGIKNWLHFIANEHDLTKIKDTVSIQTGSSNKTHFHYLAQKSVYHHKRNNNYLLMALKSLAKNQNYTSRELLDLLSIKDTQGNTTFHDINNLVHFKSIIEFFLKAVQKRAVPLVDVKKAIFAKNKEGEEPTTIMLRKNSL